MPQQPRPAACPNCDRPLEADAVRCTACGASVTPGPDDASGPTEDASAAPGAPEAPDGPAPGAPDPRVTGPLGEPTVSDAPAGGRNPGGSGGASLCVACRTGTVGADGRCEHCGHVQPRERDHMEEETDGAAAVSDRGLRHHRNEDAFDLSAAELPDGTRAVVAVVCDGVSSSNRPDEASTTAARTTGEALREALAGGVHPQQAMHAAILRAQEAVAALAEKAAENAPDRPAHGNAPACTVVVAVIASGILTIGWVGDSRAYWVPDDRSAPAARLTEDDSWASRMVAAGLMSQAQAYADPRAHAITGWLGADAQAVEPHTASYEPDGPGVLVVCTDGLWNYTEAAAELALAVPGDARTRPLHCCQALVGLALDAGGHDNVTVAVLPFVVPGAAGEPSTA